MTIIIWFKIFKTHEAKKPHGFCTLELFLLFSEVKLVLQGYFFNKIDSVRNILKKAIRPSHM